MSHQRMLQLDPAIPVTTDKGKGQALGWLDYSQEHHLLWIVAQDFSGEIWLCPSHQIRLRDNPSLGRHQPEARKKEEHYHGID